MPVPTKQYFTSMTAHLHTCFCLFCFALNVFYFLYMRVLLSQVFVNHFSVWCPQKPEEDIRPLEPEFHIIVSWE